MTGTWYRTFRQNGTTVGKTHFVRQWVHGLALCGLEIPLPVTGSFEDGRCCEDCRYQLHKGKSPSFELALI